MTRTVFLLPVILLAVGCSASPAGDTIPSRHGGTDSGASHRAPEADPEVTGLQMVTSRARRLQEHDLQAWLTLSLGTTSPMNMASQRHRHINGHFPEQVSQIAPYCFLWPALDPEVGMPIPLVQSLDTSEMTTEAWLSAPRGLQANVQVNAPPTFVLPAFVESTTQVQFHETAVLDRLHEIDLASSLPRQLTELDRLTPESLEILLLNERPEQREKVRHYLLQKYRRGAKHPEDARLAEFANQLRKALNDGSTQTLQFPDTLSALRWSTALTLINVIERPAATDPAAGEAALRVSTAGTDGIYRFELWYASGLKDDFVIEYEKPSVTESRATETPYQLFSTTKGTSFQPFGSWQLVDVARASLPRETPATSGLSSPPDAATTPGKESAIGQ